MEVDARRIQQQLQTLLRDALQFGTTGRGRAMLGAAFLGGSAVLVHRQQVLQNKKRRQARKECVVACSGLVLHNSRFVVHHLASSQRNTQLCRAKAPGDGKQRASSGRAASGQSFNKLLKYLLPLVGKRIAVLVLLAVLRTALANRLARVQVISMAMGLDVILWHGCARCKRLCCCAACRSWCARQCAVGAGGTLLATCCLASPSR